jgi:Ni/Fe-hydrogenase subunit HybB-like protein
MALAVSHPPRWYPWALGALLAAVGWGIYAWTVQIRTGLGVTGLHDRVPWGLYIVNFVFLIGISHAGTLVSAILRLSGAEWRRPITRMAEVITAVALMTGGLMPLIDMGRPDRILYLVRYGQLSSPLIWDILSIATYLAGSLIYLYIPMIPDLARLRDRLGASVPRWQRWLYRTLSAGWQGTSRQHQLLERGLSIMAILIIPIAVSVHTVVSFIFSMTLRPGWHSSIFGPYFVVGAIFSGIGGIIMAMWFFRRVYRLEHWITVDHFRKLGWLLLTLNLVYFYFTFAEYLTVAYQAEHLDGALLNLLFTGSYALQFWLFVILGMLVPALLVVFPRTRTVGGITLAAVLVNIGMWLKRFVIVVPSLAVAQTPAEAILYRPTWVEWSIMAGAYAGFFLLYLLFSRVFPIISVWEVEEAEQHAAAEPAPLLRPAANVSAGPLPVGQGGGADD